MLPVSDDGGSTAEIVRVLGGPAVGDIRSRCLRLADDSDDEVRAMLTLIRVLAAHRTLGREALPSQPFALEKLACTVFYVTRSSVGLHASHQCLCMMQ